MTNIFEKHKEQFLEYIQNEGNIKIAYLFGSYADNTYDENSDIDIAIMYKDNMDEYEHSGKSIDVSRIFEDIEIDYIDITKVNVFLQFEILKKGKIIYCENEDDHNRFVKQIQELYIEMDYERKKYINYVLNEEGEGYGTN